MKSNYTIDFERNGFKYEELCRNLYSEFNKFIYLNKGDIKPPYYSLRAKIIINDSKTFGFDIGGKVSEHEFINYVYQAPILTEKQFYEFLKFIDHI